MIGIMQGRLTEPKGRGIQFFPFENWEIEFHAAQKLGLDEIEFIFDFPDYEKNPLWLPDGRETLKSNINTSGVAVNAICFDYFMRRPFFKYSGEQRAAVCGENSKVFMRVLAAMHDVGIRLIEIPLVDESSMKTEEEMRCFREWLSKMMRDAPAEIRFGLETDFPPQDFRSYIESFRTDRLGANYDSGNSSGIGYDLYEEIVTLKDHIFNIHIKDRVFHGKTVPLGTGDADFEGLFQGLKEIGYQHGFILQAARGEEGREKETITEQVEFVKTYAYKYGIRV